MKLKYKYTGRGIGVAVLDTGIFPMSTLIRGSSVSVISYRNVPAPMMITATAPMWPGSSPGAGKLPRGPVWA